MSSDTPVKATAAPDIPEDADFPRLVPQHRPGRSAHGSEAAR
nr:hypothetical protein [Streptomyces antibioticus]